MSSIPSFITELTSSIYGTAYEEDPLIAQFRAQLGLSPGEPIPDTPATEQAYLTFLSGQPNVLQFISKISAQVFGSDETEANVQSDVAQFRSSLHLQPSDPLPNDQATEDAFVEWLSAQQSSPTILPYIAKLMDDWYGSAAAATGLIPSYRASLGLVGDEPLPPATAANQAAFVSALASQSQSFSFISQFTLAITGSDVTDAELTAFRGYLGLEPGQPIPDEPATQTAYIAFLGQTNSMATYAATAVLNAYGTSITQHVSLLTEFAASLGLSPGQPMPSDSATKHALVYFLTSPTAAAAQAFYGISQEAADSLAAFRATLNLPSSTPLPTDDATLQAYFAFLAGSGPSGLGVAAFMEKATQLFSGSALTNALIAKFRTSLSLKSSEAIPDDDATEGKFISFLQGQLSAAGAAASIVAVSPESQAVRNVMFSAFSVVISMLNALEKSASVESQALNIYAQWEEQYTNQMAATPIYGPTIQNRIVANNSNFGATTLGYAGITVQQVAQYLFNQIQTTNTTSASFAVSSAAYNTAAGYPGFPAFDMEKNSDGSYSLYIRAPNTDPWGDFAGTYTNLMSATISPPTSITGQALSNTVVSALMSQLTTKWQTNAFDASSFAVDVNMYSRDSTTGKLVTSGQLYRPYNTSDLKTLWSGQGNEVIEWPSTNFGGYGSPYDAFPNWFTNNNGGIANAVSGMNMPIQDLVAEELPAPGYNTQTVVATISGGTYAGGTMGIQVDNVSTSLSPNSYIFFPYIIYPSQNGSQYAWGPQISFTTSSLNTFTNTGIWGPWNFTSTGAGAWPETIPYPSSFSKTSLQNVRAQTNTFVGEVNAQLQQYIQTAEARKTNINNSFSAMQNLISQTTQAVSNQTNLLDAIMQNLNSLLTTLFH